MLYADRVEAAWAGSCVEAAAGLQGQRLSWEVSANTSESAVAVTTHTVGLCRLEVTQASWLWQKRAGWSRGSSGDSG
jgi:hypothetical protein